MKKSIQYRFQIALIFILLLSYYFGNAQTFLNGGDVSWLPQMDATGFKFYNNDGIETDCLQLLKDKGINTVRIRVFVNPSTDKISGHCSPPEAVALAVRANAKGMKVIINFHYSDTFANPGQQTKPAAWANLSFTDLKTAVYNHTYTVLNDLKTAGVIPIMVQIGNEIPVGLLWPEGRTTNWSQLAQLLNQGYAATKAVDTAIKVIIHLDQGNKNSKFRSFFDNATANNVNYDVIGMSYYPYWLGQDTPSLLDYNLTITALEANLKDMVTRYGKEVMVVEIGGEDNRARNTYDMTKAVIAAVKSVPNNKGLGVQYVAPNGARSWSGYALSAWQSNGKPSDALNAFSETLPRPAPDEFVKIDGFVANLVQQGKTVTANLTYTANKSSHFFYVGLVHRQSDGTFIKNIVQSTNNQFLVPSVGENFTTQVALIVPSNTIPSANLPNGEYYDVTVQLWSAGTPYFGTKLFTSVSSILNIEETCNCTSPNSLPTTYSFAKGADTGWLPQMEATGYQFYDTNGIQKDCLQLLKDRGINTIRLRVFVNPSSDKTSGHCSPSEVTTMAVRAKNMGFRIMINFHYSDTFAHPGQQTKPAAWASLSFANLKTAVYNHTYSVLNALKASGVTPEWVQIGNEIGAGLLYPDGDTPNFSQIAQLLNQGYNATKAINSQIKVVVHVQDGSNNQLSRWFFDYLTTNNTLYDVIGMSYYPYHLGTDYTANINSLGNNLNDMVSRYNKEVMVVEVGGEDTAAQNTKDMLIAVMNKVKAVPNNKGLGVIYWEPQGASNWSGYNLSTWQTNGKPTIALDAFSD